MSVRSEKKILVVILIIGSLLRFWNLGTKSLWKDELFSAVEASKPVLDLLTTNSYAHYGYAPVHYLFTHLALLFGNSDFIVRLPTVIFGILSIVSVFFVVKSIFSIQAGLLSAFLLSISTLHLQYSQEVRYYSYLVFFSSLTLLAAYKLVAEKKKTLWILLFLVSTVINLATQLTALLVLAAELVFFTIMLTASLIKKRQSFAGFQVLKQWTMIQKAGVLIAFTTAILIVLRLMGSFSQFIRTAAFEPAMPPIAALGYLAESLGGTTWLGIVLIALFLLGIIIASKRNKDGTILLTISFFLPILTTYFFRSPTNPGFLIRYIIFILIPFLGLAAVGLTGFHRFKPALSILLVAIALLSLLPLRNYYKLSRGDWRGVAEYIRNNSDRGDVVIADGDFNTVLLDYYLKSEQNGLILKKPTEPLGPQVIPFRAFYFQHDYQKPDGTPNPSEVFLSNPKAIISFPADISPMHLFISDPIYFWQEAEGPVSSSGWAVLDFYGQKLLRIGSADLEDSIVSYRIEVPQDGRYLLHANLRLDNLPGIIKYRLDNEKWSAGFQPKWDGVGARTKEAKLGSFYLTSGEHQLSFKNQNVGEAGRDQAIDYFYLTKDNQNFD